MNGDFSTDGKMFLSSFHSTQNSSATHPASSPVALLPDVIQLVVQLTGHLQLVASLRMHGDLQLIANECSWRGV